MKLVSAIARVLLGLMFTVFGLNGFLHFLPMGPLPSGAAGQFMVALIGSHYFGVVAAIQLAAGALLLVNRFVPLGLTLLGPVLVNILLFHMLLEPSGIAPGVVATLLWILAAWPVRGTFLQLAKA